MITLWYCDQRAAEPRTVEQQVALALVPVAFGLRRVGRIGNVEPVSALANRISIERLRKLKIRGWRLTLEIRSPSSDVTDFSVAETNQLAPNGPKC